HEIRGEKIGNILSVGSELTRNDVGVRSAGTFGNSQHSVDEDMYAFFVQDSLELFQKVILTAGLRYDHDHYDFQDELDPTGSGTRNFIRTTPRAGIAYKLEPRSTIYFNY